MRIVPFFHEMMEFGPVIVTLERGPLGFQWITIKIFSSMFIHITKQINKTRYG